VEGERVPVRELLDEIIGNQALPPGSQLLLSPELPVLFTGRLPLYQVFDNLVSNAIKYNDKKHPQLAVWHEEKPEHYVFFVQDNGPGISPAYHGKIFQIFQTLQTAESPGSTGVGLAIVKKILDARHEAIYVSSQDGLGTTFSFTWKKQSTWKK
ncbi:MAG: histidine kinase, partial [Sphingobacteriales bacterium]